MSSQPTRVLLIEDNPGDADLVRLRLLEGGMPVDVSCVNRLAEGLALLAQKPPSVVLLDLNLPDSHGAETFRRVLESAPDVPVVILSGQEDEKLAIKAVHQGVQDYLVKGDLTSKHLERSMRYAMERQACCDHSKSAASSRSNSKTASSPTSRMSCALRLPAFISM
jgi:DNA-binding NarL/FixJ family response regulator